MKKVLIADDSPSVIKLLKDLLGKKAFRIVAEASNGEEAVKRFFEYSPDLVIMDLIMPIKDGASASREILAKKKNAKILILSSIMNENIKNQLSSIGINACVPKPFQREELLTQVKMLA